MPGYSFDAVIFDLDGVITKTALVHSAAWKKMFDDYLKEREFKYDEPYKEFSHELDYLPYVDGKPRYKGVESFLTSRGISIPFGDPADTPEVETICGIGNRKNIAFNKILEEKGIEVYDSTIRLIHELKSHGIHVGVASSSKNCESVLQAAGLHELMETRVDGIVSEQLRLKGKPEPDIFTTASEQMGATYDRAVVVEDAVSGVQAGKTGNFGLVIGIAREGNDHELKINGADIVVKDLEEISLESIETWFREGLDKDSRSLSYFDYDPGKEKTREALMTVGNGYFGTRGAMEESMAGPNHYPGTYIAGVYNRLKSKVGGREIENEDLVNCINWLPVSFRIGDGKWMDVDEVEMLEIKRVLHFDNGVLYRRMTLRDQHGRQTRVESRRISSMDDPHLAALEYSITPLNYSEKITVRSGLHGNHINAGVERYKQLNQQHLQAIAQGGDDQSIYLQVGTTSSGIEITAASRIKVFSSGKVVLPPFKIDKDEGWVNTAFTHEVFEGETLTISKLVSIFTSVDEDVQDPLVAAGERIMKYNQFKDVLCLSSKRWKELWDKIDIQLEGDRFSQKLLRLHLYHMMVTASPHNTRLDVSIPARGLHGEAYRGHIFWDELYILPFYNIHFKDIARAVLMYRYRRLDAARRNAGEYGYKGAMFPWQSGSDGREETQVIHLNPVSGIWGPDHSSLQRHVSLAVAYNTWQYFQVTGDKQFMEDYGAEMMLEIARFWASKCRMNPETGRYEINKVMGPDEFHEKYETDKEGGLKDNAYTNLMVAWLLEKIHEWLAVMDEDKKAAVLQKTDINGEELVHWKNISEKLNLVVSPEGIIAQYDGYFDLKELDWEAYKKQYGNVYRMDRILKAEGKSPDEYKVAKQADTLMTFYNLDKSEVDRILDQMGCHLPPDYLRKNLTYYLARTSHGSTLSKVVHSYLANLAGDKKLSWELYSDAISSDYQDIQGGTTAEGIHAGVMAGTIWIALASYAGLNLSGNHPRFNPVLPDHWRRISFSFTFRDDDYFCEISKKSLRIKIISKIKVKMNIEINRAVYDVLTNQWSEFPISNF